MTNDKRLWAGVAGAILVAAAGGFGVARCTPDGSGAAPVAEKKDAPAEDADRVAMDAPAIATAGIVVQPVMAGGLGAEISAQATVVPVPTGAAVITARAGGAVIRVFKRLGDPVRAGEALAVVESRDAAQIAADRSTAAARATLAQRNLARERYLVQQKVSARIDLEKAEAEAAVAAAEVRRAQVSAGAANITADGRGVVVASPIAGRVTAASVTLGAYVQPEAELFRVADPSRIQVEAAVSAADAERLKPGDRAIVELASGRSVAARVRAITPTLSGETRAATAVLDAAGPGLQPGLAVRVRLMPSGGGLSQVIAVPEEAVQSVEGRSVVFVRTGKGFRVAPVSTGSRSSGRIEILSGLKPGQQIAAGQAFLLKAELAKGAGEEH